MSRVGLKPIPVPPGVEVHIDGNVSRVKGPKGELLQHIPSGIDVSVDAGSVRCTRSTEAPRDRANHGLVRMLISNQVVGVTDGFSKTLTIIGVGYKAQAKGKTLLLNLGFSHPVNHEIPEGIKVETPTPTSVVVSGADKQKVGQVAAEIRGYRPPEPYKGKGVRYVDENVRKKAGKSATKA
jgi:large subunit ribosomal protein L6